MLFICPSAGVGSRLSPLTKDYPKALLPLAGQKIIDHIMAKIEEIAPPNSLLCFITGYQHELLENYLQTHYATRFELIFKEQTPYKVENKKPIFSGLGDAISLASEWGKSQDCFVFLSDRLPLDSFKPMIDRTVQNNWDGIINVSKVDDPQHYGICETSEDHLIVKVEEKPSHPSSNLAISGAYFFRSSVSNQMFEKLNLQAKNKFDGIHEHQFTNIIQELIEDGAKIGVNENELPILDLGRPENLFAANNELIELHPTHLFPDIKLENSNIHPPVILGKNCQILNSKIGPYVSIGDQCVIESCAISHSSFGSNIHLIKQNLTHFLGGNSLTNQTLQVNGIQLPTRK